MATKRSQQKMQAQDSTKARNDVNCIRKLKRVIRRRIGWNKCPMRYQLRVHLSTLFGSFFLAFFVFLWVYAKLYYQDSVVSNLSTEWPGILQDRLTYSSESISTAFYMSDKAFLDTLVRVENLYREASKEMFPIRQDAYPFLTQDQARQGEDGLYCDF